MSVLETFWILFKTNSDDVKKGTKVADDSTKKLNESLTASDKVVKNLSESFTDVARKLSEVVLAFVGVDKTIEALKSSAEYSENLYFLSKQLQVSSEDLDTWGKAAEKSGESLEGFRSGISSLVSNLSTYRTFGGGPLPQFLTAHLQIGLNDKTGKVKDPFELLREISAKFEKLPHLVNLKVGQQLGFDPSFILFLEQGPQKIDKLIERQKELGVVTDESGEIVKNFRDAWLDLSTAFQILFLKLDVAILPILTTLVNKVTQFVVYLQTNSPVLKATIAGIGVAFAVAGTIAFASFSEILIPLAAITAALVGIPALAVAAGSAIQTTMQKINEHDIKVDEFNKNIKAALGQTFKDYWKDIVKIAKDSVDLILGLISKIGNAWQDLISLFHGKSANSTLLQNGKTAITQTANVPLLSQNSYLLTANNLKNNRNVTVNVGDISIQTMATDQQSIAANFVQSLQAEMRKVISNFDDGVLA